LKEKRRVTKKEKRNMAKASRSKKARKGRRWFKNVGDPVDFAKKGIVNPNDQKFK